MPTSWTSSAGSGPTTRPGRPAAASASTAWTSTACTPRWRRSSRFWTRSIRAAAARARAATRCFDRFGDDMQAYGYATAIGRRGDPASVRWSRSWSSCAGSAAEYASATAGWQTDDYFYAEQNARLVREAEAVLPDDVRRSRGVVEPARPPHGRHAGRPGRVPRQRRSPGRESWSGRTTRTSATRGRRRWAQHGELNVGQLVRERSAPTPCSIWVHHRRREP